MQWRNEGAAEAAAHGRNPKGAQNQKLCGVKLRKGAQNCAKGENCRKEVPKVVLSGQMTKKKKKKVIRNFEG